MDIEIKRGLAEARMLAGEHRGALAAYVGIGVVLPFLLLSSEPIFSLRTVLAILSDPWTYRVGGSIAGPLYLLGIVAIIVVGALLAGWNAVLAEIREGYVSELMFGMVAGAAYLFAYIVIALIIGFAAILPLLLLGDIRQTGAGSGSIVFELYRFALSLVGSWIGARLCLAGPIMAERGKLEPVSAFIESWRRTRAAQWRLFAFFYGYGFVVGLLALALGLLHGTVIVSNEPGGVLETVMSLGWVILFAGYFLGQILLPAGFYRSSQPRAAAEVFA